MIREPEGKRRGDRRGRRWVAAVAGTVVVVSRLAGQEPEPAGIRLLEGAVRAGNPAAAAAALDAVVADEGSAAGRFWRAQACLVAGRADEASRLFGTLTGDPVGEFFRESVLSHGALWAARGETVQALRALTAGLESEDAAFLGTLRLRMAELHLARGGAAEAMALLKLVPAGLERSALEARAAWMEGRWEEAARVAGLVAAQAPAGAARDTARLVQARVKAASGQILEADRALLEWVRSEPASVPLAPVVLALEEFNGLAAEEVNTLFEEWKVDPRSPLAAAAAFGQAAARAGRGESAAAAAAFAAFANEHPSHPLAPAARARAVNLALAARETDRARAWAESWRQAAAGTQTAELARAWFHDGLAAWQAGAADLAGAAFAEAARLAPDPEAERAARLNAALSAVEAGQPLSSAGLEAWPDAGRTLLYEAGMHGARTGHAQAANWLESFLASLENGDPRASAAWTALVELDLSRPAPAVAAARQHARAAERSAIEPPAREQAEWLSVLVEVAAQEWGAALQKSEAFLAAWPATARRTQARFLRAEWLGRQNDWARAIDEYATLAAETDTPPAAGARALYLAGLAELRLPSPDSLDLAIDRWSDAAAMDESLAFPARYQQALAKSRLGKTDEAIRQLDALLAGPPAPTPAQRAAVQLARGELLLLPLPHQSDRSGEALAALQSVIDEDAAASPRRARAQCRQGEALARLGRADEALAMLSLAAQPLLAPALAESDPPPSLHWPARAGLAAVSLLESSQKWEEAAALAQRLAATPGPHAAAARARASRLRLEHFLWEE